MSTLAIICTVYGLSAVVAWRLIAGHLAYSYSKTRKPNEDQWGGSILLGFFGAIVWPLLPIGYYGWKTSSKILNQLCFGAELEYRRKHNLPEGVAGFKNRIGSR